MRHVPGIPQLYSRVFILVMVALLLASASPFPFAAKPVAAAEAPIAGSGAGLVTQECSNKQAGWIWCDDFESDRLSSYFEYQNTSKFVRADDVGVSGSKGMKATWSAGSGDAGNLKVAFGRTPDAYLKAVDEGTENYREIYWRFYVKNGPTWTATGAQKLSRATIMASADWKQAMIGHIWSAAPDNNYLSQDPASGTDAAGTLKTTQYNDFNNLRWLGKLQGNVPFFATDMRDKWQAVEAHIKLNDAGQSNGIFEFWVDDVLQNQQTNLNWVGNYSEYGINTIMLENYNNSAPTASMTRMIDNFVVSTQKIGLTVARQTPTVTTTTSVSEAVYGSAVTLQTVVASTYGGGAPTPTGTVTFLDGGQPIGSPVTLVNGTATLTKTDLAFGRHNITATYSGNTLYNSASSTATASVLIVSGYGSGAGLVTQECSNKQAGWIWCDDFESDRLSSYFEYQNTSKFVRADGAGVSGSKGMKATWSAGSGDAGNLKVAFGRTPDAYLKAVDEGTEKYREIYWRFYVKNGPTWTVNGQQKLSRATIMASANWKQAMIGHIWSDPANNNYLSQDPASGTDAAGTLKTTQYNDFNNLRWLGKLQGNVPFFATDMRDKWQAVEAHIKLNDAGQSNGIFEFWVDNVLQAQQTNLNWVGSYSEYGINAILLENYNNSAPTASMTRVIDNFVVSTQRIGMTVARQTPTVTSTTSVSEAVYGSAVTLQTVVASTYGSGAPTPTGTVTFLDGGQPVGSPVTLVNGNATLTTTDLALGQHSITATYSGDAQYYSQVSVTQASVLIKQQPPVQPSTGTTPPPSGSADVVKTRITVDGQRGDSVSINERLAERLISQQAASGSGVMRLVIDESGTDGKADFLKVEISKEAVSKLGNSSSPLAIETPSVTITLTQQTLSSLRKDGSDVWFRIVPERETEEAATKNRIVATTELQVFAEGGVITTLGRPVKIETNVNNRPTRLEFPISAGDLPLNPEARAAFLKQLSVFVEHSDGEKAVYRGEVKYDSAMQPVGLLIDIDKFSIFTMVSVTHPSVQWERYMFGYEDGTFRPDVSITRAEMAVLINRLLSERLPTSVSAPVAMNYVDMAATHWAYKDVSKLGTVGIMNGYPDQTFQPDVPITRAEFAKLIVTLQQPATGKKASDSWLDINAHWAEASIESAQANGWMTGYPDHTFRPDRPLTRAEAVTVLNRLLQRPVNEGAASPTWTDVPAAHWAWADIMSASATFKAPAVR